MIDATDLKKILLGFHLLNTLKNGQPIIVKDIPKAESDVDAVVNVMIGYSSLWKG